MSKGYVDVKMTVWERVYVNSEEALEEVINEIYNNGTMGEIYDAITSDISHSEMMYDTSELMTPEENGAPTIEVYKEDGELVITNEIKERLGDL